MVLVVSLAFAAMIVAGVRVPGTGLAEAILERFACAVDLGQSCPESEPTLESAYGPELAALAEAHVPGLLYEEGMRVVPVDFRSCRENACAYGADDPEITESLEGEPVTLFTHVVDCRVPLADERVNCAGEREGNVYLQYWAYYPDSRTKPFGKHGYHPDDWESFAVRISPDKIEARASSHHGYNGGSGNKLNDIAGFKRSWVDSRGYYEISAGSHAGRVGLHTFTQGIGRNTPAAEVRVIPLEALERIWDDYEFQVVPPWLKPVWSDPESEKT